MPSPNYELAVRIWDRVFNFKVNANDPAYEAQADVATKILRHSVIDKISAVLDEERDAYQA